MSGDTLTITEESNGKTITVDINTTLCIQLPANASTGYLWQQAKEHYKILRPSGKLSNRQDEIPGGTEVTVFCYKALSTGSEQIELHYERPFDKGERPLKIFTIKIKVIDR